MISHIRFPIASYEVSPCISIECLGLSPSVYYERIFIGNQSPHVGARRLGVMFYPSCRGSDYRQSGPPMGGKALFCTRRVQLCQNMCLNTPPLTTPSLPTVRSVESKLATSTISRWTALGECNGYVAEEMGAAIA